MEAGILFISDGEMGVYAQGRAQILRSIRKEKYMTTLRELEMRNAWKYEGAGAQFQHQRNPYEGASRMADSACQVTAVMPMGGRVLYALVTPDMGGLYIRELDASEDGEISWLSERTFLVRDMHMRDDQLVCALDFPNRECHIALLEAGSTRYQILTQGDTQDTAPFLSADGCTLYYASAGYARNEEGELLAKGPSALLQLNLRTGVLEELLADDATDYLRPKEGPDGALYFIRRPYQQPAAKRLSLVDKARNVGAFFKGVGKLLTIIGDPDKAARKKPQIAGRPAEDSQQRMLEGVMVDIARSADAETDDAANGCVPDTWVLVRREANGTLTEVVNGAADYDFDGKTLVYSDGRRIIRLADGRKNVLYKGAFIPRVVVCE
ncbi:MAG: hypothetical protein IJZ74_11160 [Clostridia bacterium]|nr:hypothetical protein [Clostridia bacterium]